MVLARRRDENWETVRAHLVADYEQDFLRLFGEHTIDIVQACFRGVANFVGGPCKNSAVIPNPSRRVHERINEVFARLEAWHLILRSDQRGLSPEGGHKYLPKRYLFDTGILRHLREVAVPPLSALHTGDPAVRGMLGGVIENQTAVDLSRNGFSLGGWKKAPSGHEIDFVVRLPGGQTAPLECKAALRINKRHMRGVLDYLALYSLPVGVIVSLAPFETWRDDEARRVVNVPAYLLEHLPRLLIDHKPWT